MSNLKRRSQMAAKIESVEGVAETLAAADGFLAFDPGFDPTIGRYQPDPAHETLGELASLPGERSAKMPFTVELCGSGTPGTPPFWGKLLKCCGAQEIITPGVSVEYKPASANIPSLTAALYTGSTIKKIWGARGDLNIALDKQKAVLGAFTLTGMDFSVVDGGYLAGINYTNIRGPQFLAAGFLFDSYAAVVSKLELSLSNNVVLPDNALAASGFNPAVITRRKPQLTLDPESVACSVKDFYGLWRSSSGAAVSITLGSTPGNIVTITMPIAQVEDLKLADRKEIRTRQITALLKEDAGDDEWSILLT